jgi:tetratricopeptide (TPR) repeat protein
MYNNAREHEREHVTDIYEVIDMYKSIIKRQSNFSKAHFRLGHIYDSRIKDLSMAKVYYLTTVSINPFNGDAHNNLGIIYEAERDFENAEKCYIRAIESDISQGKNENNTRFNLADLLDKKGDTEQAIIEYEKVLKNNPLDLVARRRLTRLLKNGETHQYIAHKDSDICGFCIGCLIKQINSLFSGKVDNYYGAILLHETNCWTNQKEAIKLFKVHPKRRNEMREMKYETFQKKQSEWNHILRTTSFENVISYN